MKNAPATVLCLFGIVVGLLGTSVAQAPQNSCSVRDIHTLSGCLHPSDRAAYLAEFPSGQCTPPPDVGCYGVCVVKENICSSGSTLPSPGAGPAETAPGCCAGGKKPTAGRPISLASGNTYIPQMDLSVPGLGGGLTLSRIWNSLWPSTQSGQQNGIFGPNWRSTYEERVFSGGDGTVKYARSDGSFWSFSLVYNASGDFWQVSAPANERVTLTQGTSSWTMAFKSGEIRLFDNASGSLTAIVDRNGNATQLTYDGVNRLVTVTDPAGRHLYFAYGNSSFPYIATAVTTDVGLSLAYAYDAQGRLVTVTKPDATTVSFEYDSHSFITAVKDTDGKILESHTYDAQGRGLSSAQAGGVNAVTISYPQ